MPASSSTESNTYDAYLRFALDAAWQAGRLTLGYYQTGITAERKADNSPVTLADRQAEQKLRELIGRAWPDHGIVGEEYGYTESRSRYTWILDPIDGTKSFISGVPFYSVLVALTEDEQPVLGVIYFPALDDMVYATRGGGSFWNGRPTRVSTVNDLSQAVLLTSDIDTHAQLGRQRAFDNLVNATYFQRTWGDAYGYALVATGRAEIMIDPIMAPWDCGPMQVILEEAGGTFTDWTGKPTIYGGEGLATNGALYDDVIRLVRDDG
jgi:histidinol phosphatase-like enzyme (inositol monophosphatase family)